MLGWFKKKFSKKKQQEVERPQAEEPRSEEEKGLEVGQDEPEDQPRQVETVAAEQPSVPGQETGEAPETIAALPVDESDQTSDQEEESGVTEPVEPELADSVEEEEQKTVDEGGREREVEEISSLVVDQGSSEQPVTEVETESLEPELPDEARVSGGSSEATLEVRQDSVVHDAVPRQDLADLLVEEPDEASVEETPAKEEPGESAPVEPREAETVMGADGESGTAFPEDELDAVFYADEEEVTGAFADDDAITPALDFVAEEEVDGEDVRDEPSVPETEPARHVQEFDSDSLEELESTEDDVLDLISPEGGAAPDLEQSIEETLQIDTDEVVVEQVISSLSGEQEAQIIDQPLEELLADEQPAEDEECFRLPDKTVESQDVSADDFLEAEAETAGPVETVATDEEDVALQPLDELLADEPGEAVDESAAEEPDAEERGDQPELDSSTAEKPVRKSLFQRLMERLGKTRQGLVYRLDAIFLGKKEIDEDLLDELEEVLITADLGVATTMDLLDTARRQVKRNELSDPQALKKVLRDKILEYLVESDQPAELVMPESGPFVIMVVGVNGVGKTTTIGKIANKFKQSGQSVLLVAADTFRAAAIDQLKIWAERVGADIIARDPGADPSSVVWDGLDYGVKKEFDAIIIDTAGRLHTSVNLMEELKKIRRVMAKKLPGAPHEVLLVLDATTGQNGISQAKLFGEAVGVSGLALTKLDGTAKGGIVANVCRELKIPVRFIGIGEQMDDLRDFDPHEFVDALFAEEEG